MIIAWCGRTRRPLCPPAAGTTRNAAALASTADLDRDWRPSTHVRGRYYVLYVTLAVCRVVAGAAIQVPR